MVEALAVVARTVVDRAAVMTAVRRAVMTVARRVAVLAAAVGRRVIWTTKSRFDDTTGLCQGVDDIGRDRGPCAL